MFTPVPPTLALQWARTELAPKSGPYEFLNGWSSCGEDTVDGRHLGLRCCVTVSADDDWNLGDDDVTGTFDNTWAPNALRYGDALRNGGGDRDAYVWYHPSKARLEEFADRRWIPKGMSRGVYAQYKAWVLHRDMLEDAGRAYVRLQVRITFKGTTLYVGGLGGIDVDMGGAWYSAGLAEAYLIESAAELLDEGFDQIRENTADHVAAARQRVAEARADLAHREAYVTELAAILSQLKQV